MRLYNVFHDSSFQTGSQVILAGEESNHLVKVKRVEAGTEVQVFNGRGQKALARVTQASAKAIAVEITDVTQEPAPMRAVELAPSLTKTDAFEELLNRAIELGITRIYPVETEHTVVKLDDRRKEKRRERWRRLAIERIKQCERLWLPEIKEPTELSGLLDRLSVAGTTPVALVERQSATHGDLLTVLQELRDQNICFLIGPEGGWSQKERELLSSPQAISASLGDAVLRAETAALAAAAVALAIT